MHDKLSFFNVFKKFFNLVFRQSYDCYGLSLITKQFMLPFLRHMFIKMNMVAIFIIQNKINGFEVVLKTRNN